MMLNIFIYSFIKGCSLMTSLFTLFRLVAACVHEGQLHALTEVRFLFDHYSINSETTREIKKLTNKMEPKIWMLETNGNPWLFLHALYVTSFLSIPCFSNSEHWSQKTSWNGNVHSIYKMSMLQHWNSRPQFRTLVWPYPRYNGERT